MRFTRFRIKSFKSIIDSGLCTVSTSDNILVLAGQNEAGKSAVLEALNYFAEGQSPAYHRLHKRQNLSPEVTCYFSLDDSDIAQILEYLHDLNIKKILDKNREIPFCRTGDNAYLYIESSWLDLFRHVFPETATDAENELSSDEESDDEEAEEEDAESDSDDEDDSDELLSLTAFDDYLCEFIPNFIFYDSFNTLLPGEVKVEDIQKYPAVLDFEKVFEADFNSIDKQDKRAIHREEQRLNKVASDNLNTYWRQRLSEGSKYNFSVKITAEASGGASTIEFMIDRTDGDPLFMEQKSKGFRWFSSFNLRLRAIGVDSVNIRNTVLLIDEPGQGLHEKAQEDVKVVLEELASKGAQVIYTTHHPQLIGILGHEFARIRLVSNSASEGTQVDTVARYASRKGAVDALMPIVSAMGMRSVDSLTSAKGKLVIVEGITDHYYFSALKKLLKIESNIAFIPSCGVTNVPNIASILLGWGKSFHVIVDDDKSGRRIYNVLRDNFYEKDDDKAKAALKKIKGCEGVEDLFSKADFKKHVYQEATDYSKRNSKLVEGQKEVRARLFLERVESGESVKLSNATLDNFRNIFVWISSDV